MIFLSFAKGAGVFSRLFTGSAFGSKRKMVFFFDFSIFRMADNACERASYNGESAFMASPKNDVWRLACDVVCRESAFSRESLSTF